MILEFRQPNNPLSINKGNALHWAQRRRILNPWKEAIQTEWLLHKEEWPEVQGKPCVVQVSLWFRTNHRRDPHNYTGTVVKALIDALVQVGVWPDDTPEWVTVLDPKILLPHDGNIAHYCIVELIPR